MSDRNTLIRREMITIKKIIILEKIQDINLALQKFPPENPENQYVALSPAISCKLDFLSIPHKTTLDYPGSDEQYRDGILAYDLVLKILDEIDSKLSRELNGFSLKYAEYSFFYLKTIFDVIQSNICFIKEIIMVEKPLEIITFGNFHKSHNELSRFLEDNSTFGQLLTLDGWNIQVRQIPTEKIAIIDNINTDKQNILKNILKEKSSLFNLILTAKRRGMKCVIPLLISFLQQKKTSIVIYGSGYSWDDALPELYSAGLYPVLRYHDIDLENSPLVNKRDINRSIEGICKNSVLMNEIGIMKGVDTRPILFGIISSTLANSIMESSLAYKQFSEFLEKERPKCLLLSTQSNHIDRAVIRSAHDHGIKVISWQHGGAGYCFHPMMPFVEFIDSDFHLVFGEAVKASYLDTTTRLKIAHVPEFIPVGSSSIDNLRKNYRKRTVNPVNTILYVTTQFMNNSQYISDRFDQCTYDERLWLTQKKVLGFASKKAQIKFLVKLHPTQKKGSLIQEYAVNLGAKNITFVNNERTIPQLVDDADIVIFDINSTGLLQSLVAEKPIFVFSGLDNHDHKSLTLLKKRAFVFDTPQSLIQGIEEFLISDESRYAESHGVDFNNTEFIKAYGTFVNDGRSAIRAAHIVREIANE